MREVNGNSEMNLLDIQDSFFYHKPIQNEGGATIVATTRKTLRLSGVLTKVHRPGTRK
jgi:hypothetical protein